MIELNQQQLDRLVDGELSESDRRQLIESFDGNPIGWRQCACAFLEAQEFRASLQGCVSASERPADMNAAALSQSNSPKTNDISRRSTQASNMRWWTALAACLAIGIAVGQLTNRGGVMERPPAVASDADDGPSQVEQKQILASDLGASGNRTESLLEHQYSAIPQDIEDILARLGQRVERRHVYLPDPTSNGLTQSQPVEEIEIVPVRWETY